MLAVILRYRDLGERLMELRILIRVDCNFNLDRLFCASLYFFFSSL